jgi:phosphopantetheinyl transferase
MRYIEKQYDEVHIPEKDSDGVPLPFHLKNGSVLYWSVSHTDRYGAYSLSDTPTGIDIAEYRERDISLLDIHQSKEYTLL